MMADEMSVDVAPRDADFALVASPYGFGTYPASPVPGRGVGPILRVVQKNQCASIHLVSHQGFEFVQRPVWNLGGRRFIRAAPNPGPSIADAPAQGNKDIGVSDEALTLGAAGDCLLDQGGHGEPSSRRRSGQHK